MWWENAVIYQLAPWSFQDADGDGRGDLRGVIDRMDYITGLGVDALWLTPIFESPMEDLGYDVEDLDEVGDAFGSEEDLDELLKVAHERGLRVVLDMVWSHTSEHHPWFEESRRGRDTRTADWYVWADPAPGGGPPNNWRSVFSGDSAWVYSPGRDQYYLANFLESQPDLNWHDAGLRSAILDKARVWFERGIDGMRLDAVNFYCHDPELRDNPPRSRSSPAGDTPPDGIDPDHPAARQRFLHSFCRPETLAHLAPLRALSAEYGDALLLGEVTLAEDSIELAGQYVGDDRLHLAYHSGLHVDEPLTPARIRSVLTRVQRHFPDGGSCWIGGNHDYGRTRSYWGGDHSDEFLGVFAALSLMLPGPFCLWQGDELGLPEARIPQDIAEDRIRDPLGVRMYPDAQGRDGSRTPMPWRRDAHQAGFTSADEPWLPIPDSHRDRAVDVQDADPRSLLNRWRDLLRWRRTQPAMRDGETIAHDVDDENVLMLERRSSDQRLISVLHLSGRAPTEVTLPFEAVEMPDAPSHGARVTGSRVRLAPWGVCFLDASG